MSLTIETQTVRSLAAWISSLKGWQGLESFTLQNRHVQIQCALDSLSDFFNRIADLSEQAENMLLYEVPFVESYNTGLSCSAKRTGTTASLVTGGSNKFSGQIQYSAASAQAEYQEGLFSSGAQIGLLNLQASGSAEARMVSKNKLSPNIKASASVQGAAAAVSAYANYGTDAVSVGAAAIGEAGSVYAFAEASLNKNGINMEAKAGAALLRGECELAFTIAGLKLSLTLTGAIAAVEAGAVFNASTNSFETGLNGSMGIGGGLKLKVSWD